MWCLAAVVRRSTTGPSPALGPDGNGDEVGLDGTSAVGLSHLLLAGGRERIGALAGELREPVVQVLGSLAHHERVRVDEAFGDEAWVGIDALAHRVSAHVLDATGEADVDGTGRDPCAQRRDGGHAACAHAVD